jgi:hypothetical protein
VAEEVGQGNRTAPFITDAVGVGLLARTLVHNVAQDIHELLAFSLLAGWRLREGLDLQPAWSDPLSNTALQQPLEGGAAP